MKNTTDLIGGGGGGDPNFLAGFSMIPVFEVFLKISVRKITGLCLGDDVD